MNAIFVIGDVDQNGQIDMEEFKRMMVPTSFDVVSKFRSVHKTTRDVQNAFKKFDINNDGSIDRYIKYCSFILSPSICHPWFQIWADPSIDKWGTELHSAGDWCSVQCRWCQQRRNCGLRGVHCPHVPLRCHHRLQVQVSVQEHWWCQSCFQKVKLLFFMFIFKVLLLIFK